MNFGRGTTIFYRAKLVLVADGESIGVDGDCSTAAVASDFERLLLLAEANRQRRRPAQVGAENLALETVQHPAKTSFARFEKGQYGSQFLVHISPLWWGKDFAEKFFRLSISVLTDTLGRRRDSE
jgi:hypothetical protein